MRRFEDQTPPLPEWVIVPILALLCAASALIAQIGWLIVRPSEDAAVVQKIMVVIPQRILASEPQVERSTGSLDDSTSDEDDRPPHEPFQLPRRVWQPAKPQDERSDSWGSALLQPLPSSFAVDSPPPLRWIMEPLPAGAANLMLPIEIAKIDDGVLPYRLRRLQLPEITPKQLRLAVTPIAHDDLGSVLTKMGAGYQFTSLGRQDLFNVELLKKSDVLFLTCADMYAQDMLAALPLRRFVEQGGTLYASDLRGDLVLAAFPEFRARFPMPHGIPQSIDAEVVDKGLQAYVGRKTIPLNFEAPDWRPAAFDPGKVTVCLQGYYRNNFGQGMTVPLLVKFRCQKGTVIFTSFHHTKNDSEVVKKMLDYLIFASVNARSEARVNDMMQRSRFAAKDLRPAVLTAGKPTNATHDHRGGDMQIALGFENLGARLKLTLRSPSGQVLSHEDQGLYVIEIPAAEPGLWRYTVTPIELPYRDFPIVVAVGTPKS